MSKNYFTQETEDAIVAYNLSEDYDKRSKIYDEKIHYAFFKLTQNIIHTFKFYYTEVENIEDLQHEVIIFLLSKIHRFDPSNGAKAYSYFGTIVKRWLILYNETNYKKRVNSVPVSTIEEDNGHSYVIEENNSPSDKLSHNDKISLFTDLYVEYCTNNIYTLFPKEADAKIADAILELFRKRDSLEIFNKKALYIYIREMIDAKTPKITKIADRLYIIFKNGYIFYLENGYIKF
jgi:DNA-directed RNA polymerase specialized sigma24 family protein